MVDVFAPSMFANTADLRAVIDAVPHPIFVKDDATQFVVVNEMFCALMGKSYEELVGKTDYDFVSTQQADVFRGNDLRVLATGEINENEELLSGADGVLRTIVTRKKRLVLSDGRRLLIGCITDISDFRRAEALIRFHAEHDALTGLANRRVVGERMRAFAERVNRHGGAFAVLLIDLDRFKPVNDVYGHTTGDAVLCEIAARLNALSRGGDLVARLGGAEFILLTEPELGADESAARAASIADRVISEVRRPIMMGDRVVDVGASIGVARSPADGTDPDGLLHCADVAMYRAKAEGRGAYRFFEESMDAEIRDVAALETDLRRAVTKGEIEPYYQPLVELPSDRLIGFEILARWRHPERGFVAPDRFIPIADRLGLISDLTYSLLTTACRDARRWPAHLILSLNLAPSQLSDPLLPMRLVAILAEADFRPNRIEIEVTENALVSDLAAAKATLQKLQALGMKIALDDFGTGYSSMYHLRELHFDKIKIDRSFVQSLRDNPESGRIVNAILGLTRSLGLPATAEGIEDAEARSHLAEVGCEFGQGYYFGKPVPAAEAAELAHGAAPQAADATAA
ncbi:hypothetical protein BH10PSE9_BH10PSE9_26030 [soil metagenome]